MMSLGTRQARSPAEELHTSQGKNTIAHRTRKAEKKQKKPRRNQEMFGDWEHGMFDRWWTQRGLLR